MYNLNKGKIIIDDYYSFFLLAAMKEFASQCTLYQRGSQTPSPLEVLIEMINLPALNTYLSSVHYQEDSIDFIAIPNIISSSKASFNIHRDLLCELFANLQ